MKRYKKSILIMSVVSMMFCNLGTSAISAEGDLSTSPGTGQDGWYKTKWGMTVDEVRAVLQENVVPAPPEKWKATKGEKAFMIPNFMVGDFEFEVYMDFDASGKLRQTTLVMKKGTGDHYKCFLELEASLKSKYGQPSPVKDDNRPSVVRTREWIVPSTVIVLSYWHFPMGKDSSEFTQINYQARKTGAAERL